MGSRHGLSARGQLTGPLGWPTTLSLLPTYKYAFAGHSSAQEFHRSEVVMSSGGSSRGKGFGIGRGKGGRKGPPILWDGPLGPESFPEAVYEFPVKSKSDFSDDSSLRGYDPR